MINNIITQITNSFRNLITWYEQRNSEQAVRVLYSKQIYLAGAFNYINTFLNHFTKYGTVITTLLAISSFLGLHMTPVSWMVVVGAMLIGGVFFADYIRNDYFNKSNALMHALELTAEQDSKIIDLKTRIENEYLQQDAYEHELEELCKTAEDLDIPLNKEIKISPSSSPVNSSVQKSISRADIIEHGMLYLILDQLVTYITMPFRLLRNSLQANLPAVTDAIKRIIDIGSPIFTKMKEFIEILSLVTASFSGMVIGVASVIDVNVKNQSFILSLKMVAGTLSPISMGLIYSAIFLVSATLLFNKIFFQDPYEQLATKNKQEREVQADNLNQNQLLLSLAEHKNEILREKISILKLKINLKQPDVQTSAELANQQEHVKQESAVDEKKGVLQKWGIFKPERTEIINKSQFSAALSR